MYNKTKTILLGGVAALVMTACSDNDPDNTVTVDLVYTQIEYNEAGVWADCENTEAAHITCQGVSFSHKAESFGWGTSWYGFCPSRSSDNADYFAGNVVEHQWDCMSAGGVGGVGTPFLVAYWSSMESENPEEPSLKIYKEDGSNFYAQSVYINNSTYSYYTMLNGSPWSKKFSTGDWYKVTAYSVTEDGKTSNPLDIYLLDYRNTDSTKWTEVKDWTMIDLSPLNANGAIKYIYFQVSSSDTGTWGMNTPSYFAIDRLKIQNI